VDRLQESEKALKAVKDLMRSPLVSYQLYVQLLNLRGKLEQEVEELRGSDSSAAD